MELDLSHIAGDRNDEADALSRWDFESPPPFDRDICNRMAISLQDLWVYRQKGVTSSCRYIFIVATSVKSSSALLHRSGSFPFSHSFRLLAFNTSFSGYCCDHQTTWYESVPA